MTDKAFWKNILIKLKNNLPIIFIVYCSAFLIFYLFYTLHTGMNESLKDYAPIIGYAKDLSIIFFTAGAFTVILKYLQFLGVFEQELKNAVLESKFDNYLDNKLEAFLFSDHYLENHTDIYKVWKKVTLCKYHTAFPGITSKLSGVLNNELFSTDSDIYYYSNFNLNYEMKLLEDNRYVEITESSTLRVVRPNIEPFNLKFNYSIIECEDEELQKKIKMIYEVKNPYTNTHIQTMESEALEELDGEFVKHKVEGVLSGSKEYEIERKVCVIQDLSKDREFSFGSSRIVDGINVNVDYCNKLKLVFSKVSNNNFNQNNITKEANKIQYYNNNVMLPGEKFKIFLYKNS